MKGNHIIALILFTTVIIIIAMEVRGRKNKAKKQKYAPPSIHDSFSDELIEEAEDAVESLCNTLNITRQSEIESND